MTDLPLQRWDLWGDPSGRIGCDPSPTGAWVGFEDAQDHAAAREKAARRKALEDAARVADKQAWAHGGKWFDCAEINSATIAAAIRAMMEETHD